MGGLVGDQEYWVALVARSTSGRASTPSPVVEATTAAAAVVEAVVKKTGFAATVGDGTASAFTVTHGLNSRDVIVQTWQINPDGTRDLVTVAPRVLDQNQVRIDFGSTVPAVGEFRVVVGRGI